MKILVAPDSFKESLSAKAVASAISKGIVKIIPQAEIIEIPISDGGEGLLDALVDTQNGKRIRVTVHDPLQRVIQTEYGILKDRKTAIIEMAKASGLELLEDVEKNPMVTSSFGTGQLIEHALDCGCTKIIIGIGGSATNDGGVGMIKALGGNFLDQNNKQIGEGGDALEQLVKIDLKGLDKRIKNCQFVVACDVSNPLTGKNGASFVYGAQKGGTPYQLKLLDTNLIKYASIIRNQFGIEIEIVKGSGAGGGMGAGLMAFLNAELVSGIDLIIDALAIEKQLKNVDMIFTGEGKIDRQTLQGKTLIGIARLAKKHNIPAIAITGKIDKDINAIYKQGITAIFSIVNQPMNLNDGLKNAEYLIQSCVENIMRTLKLNCND
jgi:glycerate kinase